MTTRYKSTMRYVWPLRIIFGVPIFSVIFMLFLDGQYILGIFCLSVLSAWTWRFKQLTLVFTENDIIYYGWFRKFEFSMSDIRRVSRPNDKGYPYDRMYGPEVYEIESSASKARINLLWFDPQAINVLRQKTAHKFYRHRRR